MNTDPEHAERIRRAQKSRIAAELGRSRKHQVREDWEQVKDDVMRRAVLKEFETHVEIRDALLATGDEELVEQTTSDYY
jgi:hypothetical protein